MKMKHVLAVLLALLVIVPADAAPQKKKGKKPQKSAYTKKSSGMTDDEIRRYNRRRFDVHNIYVWGGAGYSGLVNKGTSATNGINYVGDVSSKFAGGGGGLIGLGYEYNYKRLILSAGLDWRMLSSIDRLDIKAPFQVSGLEYDQTKEYRFSNLRETQVVGQLMLPVMVGMQLDKWYWSAGAKIGYSLLGQYQQKGDMERAIIDPQAYGEWTNIPSHYNTVTDQWNAKGKNPFGLDVALSAEIGIRLDQLLGESWRQRNEERERPIRMRIGLFADYGVVNMAQHTKNAFASCDAEAISTRSYQASEWGSDKLNSLLVGVKFTWMLQMNKVKEEKVQNGNLNIFTFDTRTSAPLPGTAVQIASRDGGRPTKKTTNSKAICAKRYPEGDYLLSAQRSGYTSVIDQPFHHIQGTDTARIGLCPMPVYTCVVKDAKSEQPLVASLVFSAIQTDEVIKTIQTTNGAGSVTLPVGAQCKVHIEADDHFALTADVSDIYGADTFLLEPIVKKRAIILHNLFFATNETTILPESEAGLKDLYDLLNENPEIRIRITGHTDNVGTDQANQILSEGRANSVRQNMVDRGIDASRMETEGKGESQPIATNETEEGRAQNRRVEFVIL